MGLLESERTTPLLQLLLVHTTNSTQETNGVLPITFQVPQRALVFALLLLVVRFLYQRYRSPLRKYPGPFLASGTPWGIWRGFSEEDHVKLHNKFGPVVRNAPNELSFGAPDAARQILSVGQGFRKAKFYEPFPPAGINDLFKERNEPLHSQKLRAAAQSYSFAAMKQLTPWIEKTEKHLIENLDDFAKSKQSFDMAKWLHWFSFDVLGEVAFSRPFGFLEAKKDVDGAIRAIDKAQAYNVMLLPATANRNSLVTRIAMEEMEKRLKGHVVDRKDMLGLLLEAKSKNEDKLSLNDVFSNAHGAIFAGSDSTSSTMVTFLYNVLSSAGVLAKLMEEILKADSEGKLSELVTYDEAIQLPYFQACLKEAMRIAPASGVNLMREVPPQGATICGEYVKGGTNVSVNAWVIHRDKATFGQDADIFRPERWLDSPEAQIKLMDRSMFQFGGGSRICTGRHLALIEMNSLLPQLLRRYEISFANPGKKLSHHSCSFFVLQWDLNLKLKLRK
ncbi:hypothetical protein NCU06526 [Paecilomyces variotii No. 5]|uniref:Cytochrome P450 n=1 Tax=Byssochlamys spectabilis (strain No. 5 / NBRC 109023) TaxID=1356009 RepID=V5FVZ6_BYSSN|nr:hypothetical protein NCU06526 [Paecilomyces variotii No. 5]